SGAEPRCGCALRSIFRTCCDWPMRQVRASEFGRPLEANAMQFAGAPDRVLEGAIATAPGEPIHTGAACGTQAREIDLPRPGGRGPASIPAALCRVSVGGDRMCQEI